MIKVMLAEDMHLIRGAIAALLNLEEDIKVVAEVATGTEIFETAKKYRPDVAVVDLDLPGKDGLTAAAELHEHLPEIRTLILTGIGRSANLRRAFSAKVTGFLLKDTPPDELANAIRSVAAGRHVVDGQLAMSAWDETESPLSDRETEVLRLTACGMETQDIASGMFLSVGTVRNYLTTIIGKLEARNRIDAIRIAREAGWL